MMSLFTLRNASLAIVTSFVMVGNSLGSIANAATANHPSSRSTATISRTGIQIAQTNRATNQVFNQLRRIRNTFTSRGFRSTHDPFIGNLGQGGDETITINLRQGISYAIVGVCDNDCRDLDLEVYDGNGNRLAVDSKADSMPVVSVSPRWNARFTIRAIMPSCSNEPCRYGIEVFGK